MFRSSGWGVGALAVAISLGVMGFVCAEILPTAGTFRGVYRQDRWGVGHFSHFVVAPELHETLKQYEGKPVEVRIKRAEQRVNPGPAYLYEIESLAPLPEELRDLDVQITTRPRRLMASTPFQLVCYLHNRGKKTIHVESSCVMIRLYSQRTMDDDGPSFFCKGYTRGQLFPRERLTQMGQCLVKYAWGGYTNLNRGGQVRIEPGESFPMVLLVADGLEEGGHELAVSARQWQDKQWQHACRWLPLDVARAEAVVQQPTDRMQVAWDVEGGLKATRAKVDKEDDGWYLLSLNVQPAGHPKRRLAQCGQGQQTTWSGQLTAIDRKGGTVPLSVYRLSDQVGSLGPWRMERIPKEGTTIKAKFRIKEPASNGSVDRLKLDLLTDRGVHTVWVNDFTKLVRAVNGDKPSPKHDVVVHAK